MKRKFLLSTLLYLSFVCFGQESNHLIINRLIYNLSKDERNAIKEFVLTKGAYRFYDQSYGDCPFYEFDKLSIYLLPIDSLMSKPKNIKDSKYDRYAISLIYNEDDSIGISKLTTLKSEIDSILNIVSKQ